MNYGGEIFDVALIEHDDVAKIQEQAKTDKRAALELLSNFVDAGNLVVGRGLHPHAKNVSGQTAITKAYYQAQFKKNTCIFIRTGVGISLFFGNGHTETEAVDNYYKQFFEDDISALTPAKDDKGPLYFWMQNKDYRFFQLER